MDSITDIVKPENDVFDYRHVVLANKLSVLLISDPKTEKASACMDVQVGWFSDPKDIPGVAHFLEHMLFYSSEKYPTEDEYSKFITEHGGSSNAYTSHENTNYHFDVQHDFLDPALDRFAQFFIAPLLTRDGVDRELNAVDSEHGKNVLSDPWRREQLWRHLSNPNHPFSGFGTGSIQTLKETPAKEGIDVHARLMQFYHQHYSANVMKLVVYGREGVDGLEALVEAKFAAVPNKDIVPPAFAPDYLQPAHLCRLIKLIPTREGHVLEMRWPTPAQEPVAQYFPAHYVSHLIGHEGDGSILAQLKALGWASSLSAGPAGDSFLAAGSFMVRVDLTEAGHANISSVIGAVFEYVDVVRAGMAQWIFDELKAVAEMRFNFRDKLEPMRAATTLAPMMHIYPPRDLLLRMYSVAQEYSPAEVTAVLDCLTPENCRVMWSSKTFGEECGSEEPWYGTRFQAGPIPGEWLEQWRGASGQGPALRLPEPNIFVPTDFAMRMPAPDPASAQKLHPKVVRETALSRLWYKPDTEFQSPKAFVFLDLCSPAAYSTPEASVMTRLITRLLIDRLNAFAYYAEVAGLAYSVTNTKHGLQIVVSGYNHKIFVLTRKILEGLAGFTVDAERFGPILERVKQDYSNVRYDQPYQRALYNGNLLLERDRWHVEDYEAVVGAITPAAVAAFFPALVSHLFVEGFISGNTTVEEAQEVMTWTESLLSERLQTRALAASQHKQRRMVKLAEGRAVAFVEDCPNPQEQNSAFDLLLQVGRCDADWKHHALVALLVQVLQRPVFHQLRSVEQLGYIVFVVTTENYGVKMIHFLLQSQRFSAQYLSQRVESFINGYLPELKAMTAEEFKENVDSLAATKAEKPKTPSQEARRHWTEIENGALLFDRDDQEVAALQKLTLEDLVEFHSQYVAVDGSKRCEAELHVKAVNVAVEEGVVQDGGAEEKQGKEAHIVTRASLHEFKVQQELFPEPVSNPNSTL